MCWKPATMNSSRLLASHIRSGNLEKPRKLYNQDFELLREMHLRKRLLFTDEAFPANINILGSRLEGQFDTRHITWRRPTEFCKKPRMIVDGTNLFDILQSQLGDCWVLCAMGSITLNPKFLSNIIPENQDFGPNYAGIFHFRLWHLGEWVDIVIDDMLPFANGKYLSVKPSCENEFWPCLVEKAYAKLLGSYQNLHWGDPAEAFVNLTGGITMSFDLKSGQYPPNDLWGMVISAGPDTVMACICDPQDGANRNRSQSFPLVRETQDFRRGSFPTDKLAENVFLNSGLVDRHAYCITKATKVPIRNGFARLIRVWNPWGYGEWQGDWSDKSPWWQEVREEDRQRLQRVREDGEFWISWEDFTQEFSRIIISNQIPDFLDWGQQHRRWYKTMFWNYWTKDVTAGQFNDEETFSRNPQYVITVNPADEVNKGYNVSISLMQSSGNRQKFGGDFLTLGFKIFTVPNFQNIRDKLPPSFFRQEKMARLKAFRQRDLTLGYNLTAGTYVIVPYTAERKIEASFLLQVFLKSQDCAYELGLAESKPKGNVAPVYENVMKQNGMQNYDFPAYENIFKQYATKQGNVMYAWELQRCLNEVFTHETPLSYGKTFSLEVSRGFVASLDYDGRGGLTMENFCSLWQYLKHFMDIFAAVDFTGSEFLTSQNLRTAVNKAGLSVGNDLLVQMIARYGDPEERLHFVDYLLCMVRLKTASKSFRMLSVDGKGVYINQEKWMMLMV